MLTPEQREIRRTGIGSTDIAAVVALYRPELAHLSKKKNATDVWMRLVHDIEQPHRAVMGRGTRVEPILRQLYREMVGPIADPSGTLRHSKFPWAVASPDGLTQTVVAELKTASVWVQGRWGEPGTDRVPDDYNLQCQWLLEVCARDVAHVLVAFGTDIKDENGEPDFIITETAAYVVRKNEELVASMLECGEKFWTDHVFPRVAPGIIPVHNRRIFKRLQNEHRGSDEHQERNPETERGVGEGAAGDDCGET